MEHAERVRLDTGGALQGMSRDGSSGGLSKWSSMRSRVLQLSTPSGSGNSDAAAMHLSTPISRYESSYPHGTGMWLPPHNAATCAFTLPIPPYTTCLDPCSTATQMSFHSVSCMPKGY